MSNNPLDNFFAPQNPTFPLKNPQYINPKGFGNQMNSNTFQNIQMQNFPNTFQNYPNNFNFQQTQSSPNIGLNQQFPQQNLMNPNNFYSQQNNFGTNQNFMTKSQQDTKINNNNQNFQNDMMDSQQMTNFPQNINYNMNTQQNNTNGTQQMMYNPQMMNTMYFPMNVQKQINPNQFQNFGQMNPQDTTNFNNFGSLQNMKLNENPKLNQEFFQDTKQPMNLQKPIFNQMGLVQQERKSFENTMQIQFNMQTQPLQNMNFDQTGNFGFGQNVSGNFNQNTLQGNTITPIKSGNSLLSKVDDLFNPKIVKPLEEKVEQKDEDFDADFGDFQSHGTETIQNINNNTPDLILDQNKLPPNPLKEVKERVSLDRKQNDIGTPLQQIKTNSMTPKIEEISLEKKPLSLNENLFFETKDVKKSLENTKVEDKKVSLDDLQLVSNKKTDSPAFSLNDFMGPQSGKKVQTKDLLTSLFGAEQKQPTVQIPQEKPQSSILSKVDTLFAKVDVPVIKQNEDFDADFGEFQNTTDEKPIDNPLTKNQDLSQMFDSNPIIENEKKDETTKKMDSVSTDPIHVFGDFKNVPMIPKVEDVKMDQQPKHDDFTFETDFSTFDSGSSTKEFKSEPIIESKLEIIENKEIVKPIVFVEENPKELENKSKEIEKKVDTPIDEKPKETIKAKKMDRKSLLSLFDSVQETNSQPKPLFSNDILPENKKEEVKKDEIKKEDDFDADFGDFHNNNDFSKNENVIPSKIEFVQNQPKIQPSNNGFDVENWGDFENGNHEIKKVDTLEPKKTLSVDSLFNTQNTVNETPQKNQDPIFLNLISQQRFEEAFEYQKSKALKNIYKRERLDSFTFEEMKKFSKKIDTPQYDSSEISIEIKKKFDQQVLKELEKSEPSLRLLFEGLKELEKSYQMIEEMNEINQESMYKLPKIINYFKGVIQIYQISNSIIQKLMKSNLKNEVLEKMKNRLLEFKKYSESFFNKSQLSYPDEKESDRKCFISGKYFMKGDDFCQWKGKDLYVPVANLWIHRVSKEMF